MLADYFGSIEFDGLGWVFIFVQLAAIIFQCNNWFGAWGQAQLISYSIAASDDQIVEEKKNIHTKLSLSLSFHKTKGKTFKNQKKQKKKIKHWIIKT